MEQFLSVLLFLTIAVAQLVVRAIRQRQEAAARAQLEATPASGVPAPPVPAAAPAPRAPEPRAIALPPRRADVGALPPPPPPAPRSTAIDPASIRGELRSPPGLTRAMMLSVIIGKPRALDPLDHDTTAR